MKYTTKQVFFFFLLTAVSGDITNGKKHRKLTNGMFYKYFCRRIICENNVPSGGLKKNKKITKKKKVVIGIMKFISSRKNVMKIRGGLHSSSSALLKMQFPSFD